MTKKPQKDEKIKQPETVIEDLDVPEDEATKVKGGTGKEKWIEQQGWD